MVIDSSALVAILLDEPEAEHLMTALAADPLRCINTFSVLDQCERSVRRRAEPSSQCQRLQRRR